VQFRFHTRVCAIDFEPNLQPGDGLDFAFFITCKLSLQYFEISSVNFRKFACNLQAENLSKGVPLLRHFPILLA
jgi:hypothetical protein